MKSQTSASESAVNLHTITLNGYYTALADTPNPKKDFVDRVAKRCKVKPRTVHSWIKNRRRPSNPKHLLILSEESGIPLENLWSDETN